MSVCLSIPISVYHSVQGPFVYLFVSPGLSVYLLRLIFWCIKKTCYSILTLFLRLAVIFCPANRIRYTRPKLAVAPAKKIAQRPKHTLFNRCRTASFCSAEKNEITALKVLKHRLHRVRIGVK